MQTGHKAFNSQRNMVEGEALRCQVLTFLKDLQGGLPESCRIEAATSSSGESSQATSPQIERAATVAPDFIFLVAERDFDPQAKEFLGSICIGIGMDSKQIRIIRQTEWKGSDVRPRLGIVSFGEIDTLKLKMESNDRDQFSGDRFFSTLSPSALKLSAVEKKKLWNWFKARLA